MLLSKYEGHKSLGCWCFAPNLTGEAYSAPETSCSWWEGNTAPPQESNPFLGLDLWSFGPRSLALASIFGSSDLNLVPQRLDCVYTTGCSQIF